MLKKAHTILNDVFGYKTFRPLQEKIIQSILHKKDALVIMPTGGGKSLCYQIPALIFEGLTIVVSPLISLMKDQVEQLHQLGIGAIFLNSSLNAEEYQNNIELLLNGKVKLLYVAPETLFMDKTIRLLDSIKVDCITVDEAHCISEWGHDFRPEYRKLAEVRNHFPETVCIAFTATATPRVQQDIIQSLKLKNAAEFIASFNRENLYLEIIPKTGGVDQTIKFLRKYPNQSGIIYCFSRKQVDSLYNDLLHAGYSVLPYHAGLKDEERKNNQELFIRDDVQIIVATIAFGMGINKSNVRFVIHYDLPKNIESYYQEIGRAGRDGLRSHCLLLFSYADILKIRYFINQKESKEKRIAEDHLNAMLDYAETGVCRRVPMLSYFGEKTNIKKCGMCDNCNSNEKDLVDVTIPAQKFLSCVKRTNEIFGASYIVDVLRGSKSDKVLNNGHDKLSTYNIGSEYTKKQWMYLSHQLIHNQLLESDPAYGG
ncbi:MAG: DNA helicase RecQ, partial [Ignavibacteriae bacterium HGW-Ignavibacteriae-2]|jgi:ATP-dependent DNA helicase RecQ